VTRRRGIAFLLAVALLAWSGRGATAAGPSVGGEAVFGLEADWHPLDPLHAAAVDDADIDYAIYDTLFHISPKGDIEPDLATGYTVSPDGLTYDVALRHGVKFQDGTPFNAAAVKFNLDRELDPKNACGCRSFMGPIASVATEGADHIIIHLKRPFAPLPYSLGSLYGGLVASPTAVNKYGRDYANHPIGAGPFRFISQQSANFVTVARWPGYWRKGRPYLDKVTFRAIPDSQARYASLLAGSIQSDENSALQQVLAAKRNHAVAVQYIPGLGTVFVMLNTRQAPFDKLDARRAAVYATNFAAINKGLFHGLYRTVESPFPPASWAHPAAVPTYPAYDPAKAKALLAKSGGVAFTLSIENSPVVLAFAEALQSVWRQQGLHVAIKQEDQVTLINDANAHHFQAMLYRWRGAFDPALDVSPFFACKAVVNNTGICDQRLDTLMGQGIAETDRTKRLPIYHAVAARLGELVPYDFLFAADWWRIHSPKLHGIPPMPDNTLDLVDAWLEK
jgi:peptide/nickel transport system substrate-binding protein